ncbi:MAG: dTMP kinase [Halobacteria archaeon]
MAGRLVSIEGIDGAGKDTVLRLLRPRFHGALFTAEPTGGWLGRTIRESLRRHADPLALAHLFLADHALHLSRTVRPALARGLPVVTNRYSDSRLAYQGETLRGRVAGDPVEWLREAHRPWSVWPDRTVLLVLDPREAVRRLQGRRGGRTAFEKERFLRRVQENYLRVAEEEPGRVVAVPADGSPADVARRVEAEVRKGLS